jgi:mRNA interferase RelE/StbE
VSEYSIRFARSARKELEHLYASVVSRIFPKIEALAENPHPPGCRKLQGLEDLWRIRVGHYRVVYPGGLVTRSGSDIAAHGGRLVKGGFLACGHFRLWSRPYQPRA